MLTGGSADRSVNGCWSSEFFRIDFTLWYRHAPVRSADPLPLPSLWPNTVQRAV